MYPNPSCHYALVTLMWFVTHVYVFLCLPNFLNRRHARSFSTWKQQLPITLHTNYAIIEASAEPVVCNDASFFCVQVGFSHGNKEKGFAADLSSPGTRGEHCMHFYIAALYLQRNGKSITRAEGERRGKRRRMVHLESDLRRIPLL